MNRSKKRLFVTLALLVAVPATYVVLGGSRSAQQPLPIQSPVRIEQQAEAAERPLDNDFNAAMQRDSKASAGASAIAR